MIDGRTVYTPLFAGVFWDVQDTFWRTGPNRGVSGPGGALWGGNAVNGVINVITKSAKDTQGLCSSAAAGPSSTPSAVSATAGNWPTTCSIGLRKYTDRDSTLFMDGRQATNDWNLGQGGFRLDWDAPGENVVTFQGDYYQGGVAQPQASHIA